MAAGPGRALFVVAWGALEILLFGGLIFGWASLVYVLKREGYFGNLCGDVAVVESNSSVTVDGREDVVVDRTQIAWDSGEMLTGYISTTSALPLPHPDYTLGTKAGGPNPNYTATSLLYTRQNSTISRCRAQDKEFNLVYTLATVINGVTLFANGWLMDRHGTRICRCLGILTFTASTLMMAFSTASTSFLLYPSMILLAVGGYYFIMTNFQLGNVIPTKRSTIISLYCGAYDSSAFILLLVKFAYEGGISVQASFLFITAISFMCVISTFWFMPCMRIPHPIPSDYQIPLGCSPTVCKKSSDTESDVPVKTTYVKDISNDVQLDDKLLKEPPSKADQPNVPSFRVLATSPLFLWDLAWLTCHRFASWSFVGRLNPALNRLTDGSTSVVSHYTSVYAMLQFFGIFLAPISGRLMDRKRKETDPDVPQNLRLDKLEMCIASFVLDSTIGTLLAITLSIPVLELQYVTFVLHVVHRAFLYGPNSAFIAQAFPMEHFGKLFGLAMSMAAGFSLLQFPIFMLIQGPFNGDPLIANMFTLLLMLLSFGHPIYISWYCRKERSRIKRSASIIYKPKNSEATELIKQETTMG